MNFKSTRGDQKSMGTLATYSRLSRHKGNLARKKFFKNRQPVTPKSFGLLSKIKSKDVV